MKISAVIALIVRDGLVLSVSRKHDVNDLGLPGGKVEPKDASPFAALRREVEEETGLIVEDAQPIFRRVDNGSGDLHFVETYFVSRYSGEIRQMEEGVRVAWVPFEELLSPSCQSYRAYNEALFRSLQWSLA